MWPTLVEGLMSHFENGVICFFRWPKCTQLCNSYYNKPVTFFSICGLICVTQRTEGLLWVCKPHAVEHVAQLHSSHQGCLLLTLQKGRVSCYVWVWLVLQKQFWSFRLSQTKTCATEGWSKPIFGLLSTCWPWKYPGGWFSCVLCCITQALAPAAGLRVLFLGPGWFDGETEEYWSFHENISSSCFSSLLIVLKIKQIEHG